MNQGQNRLVRLAGILVVMSALALLLALPSAVMGEGEDIILTDEVEGKFSKSITFKVTASGPDIIDEIRVFIDSTSDERSSYGYLDIRPGKQVDGEYVLNLASAGYRPPGTLIRYSYEIRDKAGRVVRTPEKQHLYLDESLEWESVSEGLLTVYYYGDFVEKRARTVLETSQKTMDNMGKLLGIRPTDPIRIISYSNYRDMAWGLPFRSQAVREELETQGQAWPRERVLLVLSSGTTVTGIASHEFTHILVAEAAGKFVAAVPAWLNEGLAEYGNVDPTPVYDRALAYAVYTRRLRPLWQMHDFGGEPDDILIGYGHGLSVVRYLIAIYGEEKMAGLLQQFRKGLNTDQALQATYDFDQRGLDAEWRRAIGLKALGEEGELDQPARSTPAPEPRERETPAPVPTALPQATAAPGQDPAPEPAASEPRRSTASCGAPSHGSAASVPVDLVMIALLGGPALALNFRLGRGLLGRLPLLRRLRRRNSSRKRTWERGQPPH